MGLFLSPCPVMLLVLVGLLSAGASSAPPPASSSMLAREKDFFEPSDVANDGRCAFVTIVLSEDFVDCTAVLVYSLRAVGTVHDVIVLVLPSIPQAARTKLSDSGAHVAVVEELENPNRLVLYKSFSRNYGILRIWQLNAVAGRQYAKAVYMDGDMVVLQNCDALCAQPELSAARDMGAPGSRSEHGANFNAGLMVFRPSEETFVRLLELAVRVESPSGGVQPLLRAGFPEWTLLDHFVDNVNVHVFEHQRASWKVDRIRSIHYTGPVKPCFTDPHDFEAKPADDPYNLWHMVKLHMDSGDDAKEAVNFSQICLLHGGVNDRPASDDAFVADSSWARWFAVADDDILKVGIGFGEMDYKGVPAYHACKHGSSAFEGLAERVFLAGSKQLRSCIDGACGDAAEVVDGVSRAVNWMKRMVQLFLKRSSVDAQVEIVEGFGSVEAILSQHVDGAVADARETLLQIAKAAVADPRAFTFDFTTALARTLRQRGRLLRWHLTYALLGLLWWQFKQLHHVDSKSFAYELPSLEFHDVCCRRWDVVVKLLAKAQRGAVAVLVGAPYAPGDLALEEYILATAPGISIVCTVEAEPAAQLAELASAYRGRVRFDVTREEIPLDMVALVLVDCPGDRDPAPDDESAREQYNRVSAELSYWEGRAADGSSGGGTAPLLVGCGFSARNLGLVEAVSQHAIRRQSHVSLATDGVWWLEPGSKNNWQHILSRADYR